MPPRPRRPAQLTDALAEQIYACLWAGEPIEEFTAREPYPTLTTFQRWRREQPAFGQNVAHILRERPRPMARRFRGAVSYSPERAQAILSRLAAGETLQAILRSPGMPSWNAVYGWERRIAGFRQQRLAAQALAPPRPRPKPWTKFTPELAELILDHLATGWSLNRLERLPGMPRRVTIYSWRKARPDFAAECRRAIQIGREMREDMAFEAELDRREARIAVMERGEGG